MSLIYDDDVTDDEATLLETLEAFDFRRRRVISELRARVAELEAENLRLRTEALDQAKASTRSLLGGILAGAFDGLMERKAEGNG